MQRRCEVADVAIGTGRPLCVIGGPCALESRALCLEIGERLAGACREAGFSYIFKASFDKANRTSRSSPRGPGIERGLEDLAAIRAALGAAVTTDLHDPSQAEAVAEVVDLLQIPAFLCRQTDLLEAAGGAAGAHGRAVNIKKGQFLSPAEMAGPVAKVVGAGARDILVTERGTFFGYNRLVNDFVGVGDLLETGGAEPSFGVCFDCTHSVQQPGAGQMSGGRPERAPLLARAAVSIGVDALFLECHPQPSEAMSDAASMLPLEQAEELLRSLGPLRRAAEAFATSRA